MPARRIPKYREQKSRGLAVVRIDGKDHYLGPYDSSESHEKYDSLIADWLKRQKDMWEGRLDRLARLAEALNEEDRT